MRRRIEHSTFHSLGGLEGRRQKLRATLCSTPWTSTNFSTWRKDFDNFSKIRCCFQVNGVSTEDHDGFIKIFCSFYNYNVSQAGDVAVLAPEESLAGGGGA